MAKGIPLMGRGPGGKAKIINVAANGDVEVTLSGTIIKVGAVINAVAIRDTNWHTTQKIPYPKGKPLSLIVRSTLDQNVTLSLSYASLTSGSTGSSVGYFKNAEGKRLYTVSVPAGFSTNFAERLWIGPNVWDILEFYVLPTLHLHFRCSTAPTSGSLTVEMYGRG
jgi:hypothetical protein